MVFLRPAAEYSPFYGIEKGAVLQESRIFNDPQPDPRRCQQVRPSSTQGVRSIGPPAPRAVGAPDARKGSLVGQSLLETLISGAGGPRALWHRAGWRQRPLAGAMGVSMCSPQRSAPPAGAARRSPRSLPSCGRGQPGGFSSHLALTPG